MSDKSEFPDVQLVAALREAIRRAAAADELSSTTPTAPDRLLDTIMRTAARAIPCPEGALFLVDPIQKRLTFTVVIGETAERVKDLSFPLGHGIAGLVAVTGQPIAVANAELDPRHARDIAARAGYFPTTILAVPVLASDGTVVGVVELLDRQEQATFSLGDMELLGHFAQMAATTLEMRRAATVRGLLTANALSDLSILPDEARAVLTTRIADFVSQTEADPAARQTLELATAVASLAGGGDAERRLCLGILDLFGDYAATRPSVGVGMGDLW